MKFVRTEHPGQLSAAGCLFSRETAGFKYFPDP